MSLKLYHFAPSPPSRSALLTARALDLDVEVKIVNLFAKEQLNEEFVSINPQHCIPTLDDKGFILWESRAIAGYLVSKYGKDDTLYPNEPQKRAEVDRLLYFDAGTLFVRIRAICFPALFLGEKKVSQEKKDSLNQAFGFLETFLEGKKWLAGGDHYTIADIANVSSASSILAAGWNIDAFPNVKKWIENCAQSIPGYEENKQGAAIFGGAVASKLDAGEI